MLEPINESDGLHGWEWCVEGANVPIEPQHLAVTDRELTLRFNASTLHHVAHLLALRSLIGLDAVRILTNGPLPFFGSASIFLENVRSSTEVCGELVPQYLPALQLGGKISTIRTFSDTRPLSIRAYLENKQGKYKKWNYFSSDPDFVDKIGSARMLGRQRWLAYVATHVPWKRYRWPHYDELVWRREHPDYLDEVIRHQILDTLGALAIVAKPGTLLCGIVQLHNTNASLTNQLVQALTTSRQTP